jgi:transposase
MQAILYCCCGIDVHKEVIEACILTGIDPPVETREQFSNSPCGINEFIDWLDENDCYNVAMESTGVYWKPVYEAIESREYKENIYVVNAHHMRNVPGRKTDKKDAQWIATLFQHGLLNPSFVPSRVFRDLREVARTYQKCVGEKTRYVNRTEKLLQSHGFKLSSVLSNIFCKTGMRILRILAEKGSITEEEVRRCIVGNVKHTSREIHNAVSNTLNTCESSLLKFLLDKYERSLEDLNILVELMREIMEPYKEALQQIDSIPGFDEIASLLVIAEITNKPDESFASAEKICSWAGLTPRNDESAGKIMSTKILKGNIYLKPILCQAAHSARRAKKSPYRDWYWSHVKRLGKNKTIIAIARKLLSVIYTILRDNVYFRSDLAAGQT